MALIDHVSFQEHRKGRELKKEEEEEAEIIFDIKHTAAQHRQYLEFEVCRQGTQSLFSQYLFFFLYFIPPCNKVKGLVGGGVICWNHSVHVSVCGKSFVNMSLLCMNFFIKRVNSPNQPYHQLLFVCRGWVLGRHHNGSGSTSSTVWRE